MKILWITRQDPRPGNSGELIYSGGLIKSLSARPGITVELLAHEAGGTAPAPAGWSLIPGGTRGRAASLLSPLPSDAYGLGSAEMVAALRDRLESGSYDAAVIDQAACGWALPLLESHAVETPILYVSHNVEATIRPAIAAGSSRPAPLRWLQRIDAAKYARLENQIATRAAAITAITGADAAHFSRTRPETPVQILPPGYDAKPTVREPITAATSRRVVIAGSFEWIAKQSNLIDFLEVAAAPLSEAGIGLQVVGKAPELFVEQISTRFPTVDFRPNVPSVSPFLTGARIGLVIDRLGGGFKLKCLDYIFHGLALAGLDEAVQDLPVDRDNDVILSSDYAQLVAEVVARIDDVHGLDSMRHRALARCQNEFRWEHRGAQLAGIFDSLPTPVSVPSAVMIPRPTG